MKLPRFLLSSHDRLRHNQSTRRHTTAQFVRRKAVRGIGMLRKKETVSCRLFQHRQTSLTNWSSNVYIRLFQSFAGMSGQPDTSCRSLTQPGFPRSSEYSSCSCTVREFTYNGMHRPMCDEQRSYKNTLKRPGHAVRRPSPSTIKLLLSAGDTALRSFDILKSYQPCPVLSLLL